MTQSTEKLFEAEIVDRKDFSKDLWKVRVAPEGECSFVAGQYATLAVDHKGKLIERAYSIVSSPYEKELEFFIELVPGGQLTPLLYELCHGHSVLMRRVMKGRFTLDLKSGHKRHLMLATVTGIAPFVSYVRTLYHDWKQGNMPAAIEVFILQGASRSWEFGYDAELERYAAEVPWLKYVPTVSRPWEDTAWQKETGRVEELIRKYADQWGCGPGDTTVYLCGHPEMIQGGLGVFKRLRFPKESLLQEVYWIPPKQHPLKPAP